jgi:hypothetical protein
MRLISAFVATISLWCSTPGFAAELESNVVTGWRVTAIGNDRSQFSHCAASVRYGKDTLLIFTIDGSFSWGMSLFSQSWGLTKGRQSSLTYSLDDGPRLSATATAVSADQIVIPLTNSTALFQAFRKGRVLRFETNNGTVIPFDLTNSSAALDVALDCARRWTPPDRQTPRTPPQQASVYVRPDLLRATASSFLAEAGITDFKFLPLTEEDFELAWEYSDQTRATFAVIRPEAGVSMERLLALTIERDTRLCKGQYQSGYMAPKYHMGSEIRRVFTACIEGAKKFTFTYSIVQLPSGALMRLGSNALGDVAGGSTTLLPRSERIEEVGLGTVGARY